MIRTAEGRDRPALEELYNLCFPGEPGFCRWFFDQVFRAENTLMLEEDGGLVSALQMLPVVLSCGQKEAPCGYLYAVGTRPGHRGGGRMARLMEAALEAMRRRGDCLAVLITQEPSLIRYYARFGFRPVFAREEKLAKAARLPQGFAVRAAEESDLPAMDALYRRACAGLWHPLRRDGDWKCILRQYGQEARILTGPDGQAAAYALLEEGGESPGATEAVGMLAPALMAEETARRGALQARWYAPPRCGGEENGCALALDARGEGILAGFGGHGDLNVLFN